MQIDPHRLPERADLLRQMVIDLATQLDANERRLQRVQNILEQLLNWRFGQRREKIDERQLFLFAVELEAGGGDVVEVLAELEQDQAGQSEGDTPPPPEAPAEPPAKPRGHGRKRLPRPLTRERIEYELSAAERACPHCAATMQRIGEEVSERLEYVPASLKVIEESRAKYACSCGGALKTAEKPAQPIEKGLASASLLAQVAVAKYADHCPLHRQEVIFRRHGAELSRKTMCGWMRQTADLLAPLYERLKARALDSKVVQTDDTPVKVLDPELPKTRTGRIWTYVGEGATVYDYTPTRKGEGPEQFLANYKGYLQADAYGGYDALYKNPERGLLEVACWAHARRKFYDARSSDLPGATTAPVRYTRSLDEADSSIAFTRLWGALESLTGGYLKYDRLVSRVAFLSDDESRTFVTLLLEHLRDVRNGLVHTDESPSNVTTYLYQLKWLAEMVLRYHLRNGRRYSSMADAAEYLDTPSDRAVLVGRLHD